MKMLIDRKRAHIMDKYNPPKYNNYFCPIKLISCGLFKERWPTMTPPRIKMTVYATKT